MLVARAPALKVKHALDEQAEILKKNLENLDIETEMAAAAAAKIAVLTFSSPQAFSNTRANGMEPYFEKGTQLKETSATLNPHAAAYQPTYGEQQQHQTSAYRNATQDNVQGSHLNKT